LTRKGSAIHIPGLHIREPWSQLILNGSKTVETRSYPLPKKHLGQFLAIIETTGVKSSKRAAIVGLVRFDSCHRYSSKRQWESEKSLHRVSPDDPSFRYVEGKEKWAWVVGRVIQLNATIAPPKKRGIVFATSCSIPLAMVPRTLEL
jgi:predicted transcriptional regulator